MSLEDSSRSEKTQSQKFNFSFDPKSSLLTPLHIHHTRNHNDLHLPILLPLAHFHGMKISFDRPLPKQ